MIIFLHLFPPITHFCCLKVSLNLLPSPLCLSHSGITRDYFAICRQLIDETVFVLLIGYLSIFIVSFHIYLARFISNPNIFFLLFYLLLLLTVFCSPLLLHHLYMQLFEFGWLCYSRLICPSQYFFQYQVKQGQGQGVYLFLHLYLF